MTINKLLSFFFFTFILPLLITTCSETTSNQNDNNALPNITAIIVGGISLNYKAPGPMPYYSMSDKYKQLILTSGVKYQGQYYAIGVYIFFLDKVEKTGTFHFTNKEDGQQSDFAVGVFQIGDDSKRLFISDSGNVTISKIVGAKITGTFNFYATEQNGVGKIEVLRGTLDFGYYLFY
jgi:hypothetical protein